ncbi:STAS domain-containing protein [Saccharothrix xinjiangensis]|uniref:Anti-sigma factor antagonist n=1 Tax=Saccharothrix xinjiangensis TaxID=204798 RepID=A0ABV9YFA5_9PSEU
MSDESVVEGVTVKSLVVGGVPVLRLAGEVDTRAGEAMRRELLAWLDTVTSTSAVDLSGVTFLPSSGLAVLVEGARHADRRGVAFAIVAGHRAVLRPFRAARMDEVFAVYPDLEQAVAALRDQAVGGHVDGA